MGRNIKTTKQEIVDYWFSLKDELELSVDASEAIKRCWRCGSEKELEKCHIIAHSLGGIDAPSNLVLLCSRCHKDNPNVTDPEIMWDWLRAYSTPFYDTFWVIQGIKEYEFIYKKSFVEELKSRNIESLDNILSLLQIEIKKTTHHFGHQYLNLATLAGVIRIVLKKL